LLGIVINPSAVIAFTPFSAIWERLAIAGHTFLIGIDHYRVPHDHSDLAFVLTDRDYWLLLIIPGVLVVLGGAAISAQDKYTLQVPGGLASAMGH
jgi:hypothetical protein